MAQWEREKRFPPAEKLVAIAALVNVDVDVLFPREGPCDLADLRCDAGYTQAAAAEKIDGLTRFTLGAAEGGRRRLNDGWVDPLAHLYGVSPEDLMAAQGQSFGEPASSAKYERPTNTAERLRGLAKEAFQDADPSPEAIAAAINAKAGASIVGAGQVAALLAGEPAAVVFKGGAQAVAVAAMASFFGVSELVLCDDTTARHRVLADLQFLAAQHNIALAARGGEGGVSGEMLTVLNDLIAESQAPYPGAPPA
ncbi:helix-turn-helix domain-containing protein [Streptomyces sp. NPDC048211]|uniref:helix-turn-helix transcriptional regulator n=1 Tax=Streptomyces sp. NPDC048211 TaxID=3365516 RepID=UPI00371FCB43